MSVGWSFASASQSICRAAARMLTQAMITTGAIAGARAIAAGASRARTMALIVRRRPR